MSEQRVAKPKSVLTRIRREARIFGDCIVGDVLRESAAEIERLTRELDEQCRLHGKGSEREAKQLAEIERLTRELAASQDSDRESLAMFRRVRDERDRLRAALEKIVKGKQPSGYALDAQAVVREALAVSPDETGESPCG